MMSTITQHPFAGLHYITFPSAGHRQKLCLFCQETAGVRAVGGASKSCEEVLYILGTVFLCILKIIINGIVHIQTKFCSFLRLGGIA